ncbi:unnamed protein product [Sympodiomycopsis kandeliae]
MPASLPPLLVDLPRNPLFAVGIPVALGLGTGIITRKSKYAPDSVYDRNLAKAKYSPPRWAFGVVWPLLYATMGYSSHLIVRALDRTPPGLGRRQATRSLNLFYGQLALNQLWTPLRFGLGWNTLSFIDILALTATVATWINEVRFVDERVAYLNMPYLAWLAYASYLDGAGWWLNGGKQTVQKVWAKVTGAGKRKD